MDDAATNLRALSMLSMVMIDREDEQEILRLAAASVPALTPCEVEACYVVRGEQLVPRTEGRPDAPDVTAALRVMDGAPGPVAMSDRDWVWAYPLSCLPGDVGYIVVSATTEPAAEHRVLLTRLAQQTGA